MSIPTVSQTGLISSPRYSSSRIASPSSSIHSKISISFVSEGQQLASLQKVSFFIHALCTCYVISIRLCSFNKLLVLLLIREVIQGGIDSSDNLTLVPDNDRSSIFHNRPKQNNRLWLNSPFGRLPKQKLIVHFFPFLICRFIHLQKLKISWKLELQ